MAKKSGRPRKLKEEDYETVRKLANLGLTKEMIAGYLEIHVDTMYSDKRFSEVYKKAFTQLGARVRTTLITKIENDTTANIYLDKVINKTTEKYQEENIKLKRESLEIEKKRLKLDTDMYKDCVTFTDEGKLED